MTSREQIETIRVVMVTNDGREAAFSSLCDKLHNLPPDGFVAIDSEFSGLGDDPNRSHLNLQVRYEALRALANTRAIFSVGLSIFHPADPVDGKPAYHVSTFDLLTACHDSFQIDPSSASFLVSHGFDFNRAFTRGIPYIRASTEKPPTAKDPTTAAAAAKDPAVEDPSVLWRWGKLPRGLLWRIGRCAVPVIVHNGLLDLVLMYAAFQAPLPPTLDAFIAALTECVPAGFWDSKVLATDAAEQTSFLSYVFANRVLDDVVHVSNASALPRHFITDPSDVLVPPIPNALCALYAFRGFCPRGSLCPFVHDAFRVVEEERAGRGAKCAKDAFKRHKAQSKSWKRAKDQSTTDVNKLTKKQRKKLESQSLNPAPVVPNTDMPPAPSGAGDAMDVTPSRSVNSDAHADTDTDIEAASRKAHTAGWDAFCTGYIFASFRATLTAEKLNKHHNHIALGGRLRHLLLRKSEFANLDETAEEQSKQQSEGQSIDEAASTEQSIAKEQSNVTEDCEKKCLPQIS